MGFHLEHLSCLSGQNLLKFSDSEGQPREVRAYFLVHRNKLSAELCANLDPFRLQVVLCSLCVIQNAPQCAGSLAFAHLSFPSLANSVRYFMKLDCALMCQCSDRIAAIVVIYTVFPSVWKGVSQRVNIKRECADIRHLAERIFVNQELQRDFHHFLEWQ